MYRNGYSIFQYGHRASSRLHPKCGPKQSDLLSPLPFNFIIDELLKVVPPENAAEVDGIRINVLTSADGLVLVTSTSAVLQSLSFVVVPLSIQRNLSAVHGQPASLLESVKPCKQEDANFP